MALPSTGVKIDQSIKIVKTLAVKKLTLRNKLKNSSILSARVFKKAQVVFSAISLPEKDF